jgi:hypothetical protein
VKYILRSLARRIVVLEVEVRDLDRQLAQLVEAVAPTLTSLYGVGIEVAATFPSGRHMSALTRLVVVRPVGWWVGWRCEGE